MYFLLHICCQNVKMCLSSPTQLMDFSSNWIVYHKKNTKIPKNMEEVCFVCLDALWSIKKKNPITCGTAYKIWLKEWRECLTYLILISSPGIQHVCLYAELCVSELFWINKYTSECVYGSVRVYMCVSPSCFLKREGSFRIRCTATQLFNILQEIRGKWMRADSLLCPDVNVLLRLTYSAHNMTVKFTLVWKRNNFSLFHHGLNTITCSTFCL